MEKSQRMVRQSRRQLGDFLEPLVGVLGRSERRVGAARYVQGLVMAGERKSIEPMAQRLGVDAQGLQQLISDSPWEDEALWRRVRQEVLPTLGRLEAWIVDETGWLKQGRQSVGVSHQYCGAVGKQANCQVCVEVVVSDGEIAAPAAGRLYLPQSWCAEAKRLRQAGVPRQIAFQTKTGIALDLLARLCDDEVPQAPVLADSLYGDCGTFRDGLRQLGLEFFLQVTPTGHTAWPKPPRLIKKLKRSHPAADQPKAQTLLQIAADFSARHWHPVRWKAADGSTRHSRLAWKEVWLTHALRQAEGRPEKVWLVVDWPSGDEQPYHCYLAHLKSPPQKMTCLRLSRSRWHVEQYFQRGKQDLGLDHYEGRSWRGFHHHLVLSAVAYLFVTVMHLRSKKNFWPDLGGSVAADRALAGEINRPLPVLPDGI